MDGQSNMITNQDILQETQINGDLIVFDNVFNTHDFYIGNQLYRQCFVQNIDDDPAHINEYFINPVNIQDIINNDIVIDISNLSKNNIDQPYYIFSQNNSTPIYKQILYSEIDGRLLLNTLLTNLNSQTYVENNNILSIEYSKISNSSALLNKIQNYDYINYTDINKDIYNKNKYLHTNSTTGDFELQQIQLSDIQSYLSFDNFSGTITLLQIQPQTNKNYYLHTNSSTGVIETQQIQLSDISSYLQFSNLSGQISSSQIVDGSITYNKILSINFGQIADMCSTLTNIQINNIVQNSQIQSITFSKISDSSSLLQKINNLLTLGTNQQSIRYNTTTQNLEWFSPLSLNTLLTNLNSQSTVNLSQISSCPYFFYNNASKQYILNSDIQDNQISLSKLVYNNTATNLYLSSNNLTLNSFQKIQYSDIYNDSYTTQQMPIFSSTQMSLISTIPLTLFDKNSTATQKFLGSVSNSSCAYTQVNFSHLAGQITNSQIPDNQIALGKLVTGTQYYHLEYNASGDIISKQYITDNNIQNGTLNISKMNTTTAYRLIGTNSTNTSQIETLLTNNYITNNTISGLKIQNGTLTGTQCSSTFVIEHLEASLDFNAEQISAIGDYISFTKPIYIISSYAFGASSYGYINSSGSTGTASQTTQQYCMRTSNRIWVAGEVNCVSDIKVKNFQKIDNINTQNLKDIGTYKFNYKYRKDSNIQYGISAQDLLNCNDQCVKNLVAQQYESIKIQEYIKCNYEGGFNFSFQYNQPDIQENDFVYIINNYSAQIYKIQDGIFYCELENNIMSQIQFAQLLDDKILIQSFDMKVYCLNQLALGHFSFCLILQQQKQIDKQQLQIDALNSKIELLMKYYIK